MSAHLGGLQLPGQAGHDVHCIGAAHADSAHTETASIHRVRVCADHHASWEGVVLQHDLQTKGQRPSHCRSTVLLRTHREELWWMMLRPSAACKLRGVCSMPGVPNATAIAAAAAAHLVDDAGARLPEANAILGASRGQEVVHLLVGLNGSRQVGNATKLAFPARMQRIVSSSQQHISAGVGHPETLPRYAFGADSSWHSHPSTKVV